MEIGVQTKGILPNMEVDEGVALIKEAGFKKVDFNIDAFLLNSDVYEARFDGFFDRSDDELRTFFLKYRNAFEKHSISPSQMHAPYPVYVYGNPKIADYMQKVVIEKSLMIANELQIPWVVIHPIKLQKTLGIEKERKMNIEYFSSLIPLTHKYNVGICLENLYESIGGRIIEGACANPNDAVWYVDTLNDMTGEENFGICLDTGHMQLVRREASEYIRIIGNRLKLLHIHENDGVSDLHNMPFTFGSTERAKPNWDEFAKALGDIGFDGTLSFETFPCMNSFPEGIRLQCLKTIYEIGCYIRNVAKES